MYPIAPVPAGVVFLSGRKADNGVGAITLGIGFSEVVVESDVELGVGRGERVDGTAEGLQPRSMAVRLTKNRTKSSFLNVKGSIWFGNGCG